jgi:opacity protein-like surface antigen
MRIFVPKIIVSMKKIIFVLLLGALSMQAYSQKGDLTVGAKGGYVYSPNYYKDILYGVDVAYHLSDPLEIVFTSMMNPSINSYTNINNEKKKLAAYSTSLDFRLYLIHQETWATGPALGGQYYIVDDKGINLGANKAWGFNLGWHVRVNLTDNLKLNGGWRYTNAKAKDSNHWWSSDNNKFDMSYNLFYLGIGYTFELR